MVSLDDTDCKSDAATNKVNTFCAKAASKKMGSGKNAESN
jgi:hypothetical protein